jgi:hypothetical protein
MTISTMPLIMMTFSMKKIGSVVTLSVVMLNVFLLSVADDPFMLSVIKLIVVMLNVIKLLLCYVPW